MDIRSMNLEEMEALAISLGEKAFRGKQLFQWVHEKQADDFDEMTNLSAAFREKLKENYCISGVRQVEKQVSKKEDTAKYLFALEDDHVIESVWKRGWFIAILSLLYLSEFDKSVRAFPRQSDSS